MPFNNGTKKKKGVTIYFQPGKELNNLKCNLAVNVFEMPVHCSNS